jgi:KaiC/GvpD/RAD55 family RecA-like ATPase
MNKYTAQQILEDPECEEIRNTVKELIRNCDYTHAILYIQEYLSLSSLHQAKKCVYVLMNEMSKQVQPKNITQSERNYTSKKM